MRLKNAYYLYLALIHGTVLGLCLWKHELLGPWFFVLEGCVLASWGIGVWLAGRSLQPVEFLQLFSDILTEHEFSARFSTVGQAEMDQLIGLYNQMLRELYEERMKLGEQRGFLERFVEASPVGVIIMDFEDRITLVNSAAATLLECRVDQLVGRELANLGSELALHLAELEPGTSRLLTWRSVRRLRLEKMAFIDRGFSRQFVLLEELTRLIDASERSAYEKLIRLMSHEVNNTVAATNSLLQSCGTYTAQIDSQDREDYANALRVIIGRNDRLNRFMSDFAQVVKLPAPDKRPCRLEELIDTLEVMFRVQLSDREITWVRSGDEDLPAVSLDREQIEQVLINIVKNGMEAIGEVGQLEVVTVLEEAAVELQVLDDGCGLDRQTQGSLFSPFFSTKPQGQGLGLTLAKEVLRQHEFDFGLEVAEDGRTRFRVRLPFRSDSATH